MAYANQTQKVTFSKTHRLPEKKTGKELPKAVRTKRVKKTRLQQS